MIPYWPQPEWKLGPLTIHAFGVCVAAALIVGYVLVNRRAERVGLEPNVASRMYLLTVLAGLLGGFLWSLAEGVRGVSSDGLLLGGLAGLIAMARKPGPHANAGLLGKPASFGETASFGKLLDLYAFALPIVLTIARVGCFLAHDHVGRLTSHWLGVQFPGGTRFDLGLLQAILSALTAIILIWLVRKPLPAGALTVVTALLLALANFEILPFGAADVLS